MNIYDAALKRAELEKKILELCRQFVSDVQPLMIDSVDVQHENFFDGHRDLINVKIDVVLDRR